MMGLRLANRVYESALLRGLKPTAAFVAHQADDDSGAVLISVDMVRGALAKSRTVASSELQHLRALRILVPRGSHLGRGRKEAWHRFEVDALPGLSHGKKPAGRLLSHGKEPAGRLLSHGKEPAGRLLSTWNPLSVRTDLPEEQEINTRTRTGDEAEVRTPQPTGQLRKLVHDALDAQPDLDDADLADVVRARARALGFEKDGLLADRLTVAAAIDLTRRVRMNLSRPRQSDAAAKSARAPGAEETDQILREMGINPDHHVSQIRVVKIDPIDEAIARARRRHELLARGMTHAEITQLFDAEAEAVEAAHR
jgi:hypothetical protein